MIGNFRACLDFTLLPDNDGQPCHTTHGDPGGTTAWGVTYATYCAWIGRPATLDEMRSLSSGDVAPLYEAMYWRPVHGYRLPPGADLMVFDHAVLSGPGASARVLQGALGVTVDGLIGPVTLAACVRLPLDDLIARVADAQEAAYRHTDGFWRFGNGWLARLDRRRIAALEMLPLSML